MTVRPEELMCPVSAVSLLTYQVRTAGGKETGDRHAAWMVSPTEYLKSSISSQLFDIKTKRMQYM